MQYIKKDISLGNTIAVAGDEADTSIQFSGPVLIYVDEESPIVMLAGVHVGCFELFATARVRAVRDLKGKTVAVPGMGGPQHVPSLDINWVTHPFAEAAELLGHVVVNSMMDKPWSQYFCCMVTANKEFVRKNPVATKRALRAILKGADACAREPQRSPASWWTKATRRTTTTRCRRWWRCRWPTAHDENMIQKTCCAFTRCAFRRSG